jgi:hypothetical protein
MVGRRHWGILLGIMQIGYSHTGGCSGVCFRYGENGDLIGAVITGSGSGVERRTKINIFQGVQKGC